MTCPQALKLLREPNGDAATTAEPIVQLAPCAVGEGPLVLPAPAEVEAELAALAAVAALKAEGNACAPPPPGTASAVLHVEARRTACNALARSCDGL